MHDGPTKQRLAQVNQRMQEIEDVVKQVKVNGKSVYKKAYDRRLHDGVEALHIDVLRPFDWFFGKRIEHPNLLQGLPDKYYSSRDRRDTIIKDFESFLRQVGPEHTYMVNEMQQIEAQPEVLMLYMVTINRMRNNLPMTGDALEQFALDPNVSDATREQFLASFHHKRPRLEMVFDETRPTFDWPTVMFEISTRVLLNSAKSAPTPTSPKPSKPPTPLGTPLQPSDRAALTNAFGGKGDPPINYSLLLLNHDLTDRSALTRFAQLRDYIPTIKQHIQKWVPPEVLYGSHSAFWKGSGTMHQAKHNRAHFMKPSGEGFEFLIPWVSRGEKNDYADR